MIIPLLIDVKIFLIGLLVGLAAIKTNSAQNYIATSRDTPMILLNIKSETNPTVNYIKKKWLKTVITFLWLYLVMISVLLLGFLLHQQIDFELLHQPFYKKVIYKFGSVLTHMIFEFSVLSILPEWLYFYTLAAGASYLEDIS